MATPLQQQMPAVSASDADTVNYLAEGFGALADPTRLRIVHLLMTKGEMCVCEFMPLLDITQSNVSFHLKALKYAGLIISRKDGRWMLYRLDRNAFERFRSGFGSVFDLSDWPENDDPASRNEATRRRLACQREQNQPPNSTQGGNLNANE